MEKDQDNPRGRCKAQTYGAGRRGGDFTVAMEIHRPKVSHQNRVSGWIDRKGKSNVIGFPGYPTDRSKKTHHKKIQTMLMVFKGRRYT